MADIKKDTTLWGIHAGRTGDADKLFLKKNVVALGWQKIGDISTLPKNREVFKEKFSIVFPEAKAGAIPNWAGQLFRFIYEMQNGDLIAYPSKKDNSIHIGRIIGPYTYNNVLEPGYPHHRPVEWLDSFPRTRFSQGALYEIGSAMSFFQIKNYADEYISALSGNHDIIPPKKDETINLLSEEIEQNTRDFILKTLSTELKGHPLEDFIAHLLNIMGFNTRISPEGTDGGIDIIAHRDELGFEPPIVKVQVKSSSSTVGDPEVSSLYGKVDNNEYGLLFTLGSYSNQAKHFARNKSNLRLIDGKELISLILKHYENFDSRYKGLIPLKRVYIPEMVDKSEE